MKKIIFSTLFLLSLTLISYAQVSFKVIGHLKTSKSFDSVVVRVSQTERPIEKIIPVINGTFEWTDTVARPITGTVSLILPGSDNKNWHKEIPGQPKKPSRSMAMFYLSGNTSITWTDQEVIAEGNSIEQKIWQQTNLREMFLDSSRSKLKEFVAQHPDSYVSIDVMKMLMGTAIVADKFEPIFILLSKRMKSTPEGKEWAKNLELAKHFSKGKPALDFVQPDVNGDPVNFSAYKGKYVLLDFWASWCVPCRATHPSLTATYQKFKDKNFTILSVSLDDKKDEWLKAIKEDGLVWTQVSDLKGSKNQISTRYNIQSIPQNYLIGPDGLIIAQNLHREELDKVLTEILK